MGENLLRLRLKKKVLISYPRVSLEEKGQLGEGEKDEGYTPR